MVKSNEIMAEEAAQLLNNPLLKAAFEGTRESLVQAMEVAPLGDDNLHKKYILGLQMLTAIKEKITTHIQTGEIAKWSDDQRNRE